MEPVWNCTIWIQACKALTSVFFIQSVTGRIWTLEKSCLKTWEICTVKSLFSFYHHAPKFINFLNFLDLYLYCSTKSLVTIWGEKVSALLLPCYICVLYHQVSIITIPWTPEMCKVRAWKDQNKTCPCGCTYSKVAYPTLLVPADFVDTNETQPKPAAHPRRHHQLRQPHLNSYTPSQPSQSWTTKKSTHSFSLQNSFSWH